MSDGVPRFSPAIRAALSRWDSAPPSRVHRLQVGLARLVLDVAPPGAAGQLELALAFIEGTAGAADLREAQQDCWTYVGSLACGCTLADSASAHAVMSCLDTADSAHTPAALAEQVRKVLSCGASEPAVLSVLG